MTKEFFHEKTKFKKYAILEPGGASRHRAITEKMSEQINQLMVDLLSEILVLIEENRRKLNIQQIPRPDEFLKTVEIAGILKISKAQAYQMMRTKAIPSFSIG